MILWALCYFLLNLLGGLLSENFSSVFEAIGRGYLLIVGFLFYFMFTEKSIFSHGIRKWPKILSLILLGILLLVSAFQLFELSHVGFRRFTQYPYFGTVWRLKGMTPSPAFLLTILSIPMLFFTVQRRHYKWSMTEWLIIILVTIFILLTLSKSILLVFGVVLFALTFKVQKRLFLQWLIPLVVLPVFLFATHILIIDKTLPNPLIDTPYTSNRVIFQLEKWEMWESAYFELKRQSIPKDLKTALVGMGPGQFNTYLQTRQKLNRYPRHMPLYDPHSTYFGALIENGWSGAILVAWLFGFLIYRSRKLFLLTRDHIALFFLLYFSYIAIEAISMDVLNFRHLWVLIGLYLAYEMKKEQPI